MTLRFRRWALLSVVLSACAGVAACALDEGGTGTSDGGPDANVLDSPVDQTVDVQPDVPQLPDVTNDVMNDLNAPDASEAGDASDSSDVADVVTTCEIDASCVSAIPADAGWTLLGISTDGGACALQSGTLLADAQVAPGACACGCTTSGTPTCAAPTFAGYTDPNCATLATDGSVSNGGCVDVGDLVADAGLAVTPPAVSGVTCDASVTGNGAAVAQSFGTCTATACTDDYCGMRSKGFRLCIAHDSPVSTCPTGFPVRIDAVASADVVCNGCTCTMKNPACTGTVSNYGATACDGGAITTFAASTCSPLTSETLSISYASDTPPTPTCSASQGSGSVQTLGSTVVCCTP